MTKRFSIASLVLAMVVFNVALLLALATPSFAGEKGAGHGKKASATDHDGDADSNSDTHRTEDDDDNDGGVPNNVPDDGDNRHPSGKDRSVEHGKSGNQGRSESNPDDSKGPMRHEGEVGDDKPNGPGGTDLADQDGNNGCGNDDDFDDDNNGWCGKPHTAGPPDEPCSDDMSTPQDECNPDEPEEPCVDDMATTADECNPSEEPDDDEDAGVLSGAIDRSDDDDVEGKRLDHPSVSAAGDPTARGGAMLPFTGGDIADLLALASLLVFGGVALLRTRRRSTDR